MSEDLIAVDLTAGRGSTPRLGQRDADRLRAALAAAGGNKARAARLLGITRACLVMRMKRGLLEHNPGADTLPHELRPPFEIRLAEVVENAVTTAAIEAGLTREAWIARAVRRELLALGMLDSGTLETVRA